MNFIIDQWYRYKNGEYYQYQDEHSFRIAGNKPEFCVSATVLDRYALKPAHLEPDFRGPNIIKAFDSEEHKEVEGRLVLQHGINRVLIYDVGLFYVDGKKSRGDKHPRLFKDAYQAKAYFAEEAYQSDKKSKQLNEIMRSKHAN